MMAKVVPFCSYYIEKIFIIKWNNNYSKQLIVISSLPGHPEREREPEFSYSTVCENVLFLFSYVMLIVKNHSNLKDKSSSFMRCSLLMFFGSVTVYAFCVTTVASVTVEQSTCPSYGVARYFLRPATFKDCRNVLKKTVRLKRLRVDYCF